ncbi:kinesin motor domain-containing protein [Ditylenchus destructor]|uniref:Kinesin-like protein n=1 Tax=Ditylenchus destructor TaxID=166010 RepID=A0AAD4R6N6_9BILA|nr:kinesin motor domain-containing protein [Ditylenchus destructor]
MTQLSRPQTSAGGGETVKVVVRCRPMSQTETAQGHRRIVSTDPQRGLIEVENPKESEIPAKCFTFDSVYDENSKQIDLYVETFRELVDSVLNGFNGTIFAYGQTGTGKTFTMEGSRDNAELRGVIPNAIDHIFQHIAQSKNQQYLVRASYLEIYQEEIRDLLDKDSKKRLELKERPDIGVYVKDLSSFVTKSVREIEHVMSVGHSNRSVGRTNMNEHSSRSHAIFIITIECSEVGPDGQSHIRVGRLNLVDLAGSERQTKAGTVGERFKEATKINLSLSALGNVISALVDGKSSHVPYRDSKLTRLLQDSLGGNSKTVMVANIGPASYNYDETLGTLRYASRAKNIKNQPKINEDPKDALLREFQDEINRLKGLLEKRTGSGSSNRRRRRHKQADDGREDEGIEEINSEDYVREQQLKLEAEREQLMRNNTIVEEEKRRMLVELEDRAYQLAKEREAQAAVAAKIRAMQSKLLSGDGNLLDQTRKQQEILQQRRIELAEQKRREREVAQRLEAQEDNTAEIKQTFANLQQEIEAKSRKLQKFLMKHQQIRLEMQDSAEANSRERQSLESSVSEMNKELKLKWMLIENFIPMDVIEHLKERAYFDEDEEKWVIMKTGENSVDNKSKADSSSSSTSNAFPNMRLAESETRQSNSGNATRAMVDSGMDTGTSDVSSSHEFPSNRISAAQLRRPVSMVGLRRPMCTSERVALERLRQRCHRSTSTNSIIATSSTANAPIAGKIPAPSCIVLEEVARFACENLLTFDRLIYYPSQVHSSSELSSSSLVGESSIYAGESASQNVVIDTSRIPIPRSASRGSRSGSARRNSSTSSSLISKNVRARSVLGKATTTSAPNPNSRFSTSTDFPPPKAMNGISGRIPIPTTPVKSTTSHPSSLFPKARGLVTNGAAGGGKR